MTCTDDCSQRYWSTNGRRSGGGVAWWRWGVAVAVVLAGWRGVAATSDDSEADDTTVEQAGSSIPDDGVVDGDGDVDDGGSDDASGNAYAMLDIEELLQVKVTSVAGVGRSWFETPAAITVLTGEDIRRAGHRSIPEALRLVPGLHVARVDSSTWAISARGFSNEFANKLQVLMDGRRLYDPVFSGVYWDVQDTVMENLDRIEVIRGPGATLWGANAVNGVINITTKDAADTQGWLVTGGGGSFERGMGTVRYGGRIDDDTHYRVYGKYRNFGRLPADGSARRPDSWDMWQGGFRVDTGALSDGSLTVQGDVYHLPERGMRGAVPDPSGHFAFTSEESHERVTGGNVLARLERRTDVSKRWALQAYVDRTDRQRSDGFRYTRNSFDLDFRQHFPLGERHQVVWGANYRHDRMSTAGVDTLFLSPDARSIDTFSGFVQDTMTLLPDRLFAMIGTKLEHNDFSGFEIQPSARLWWTPDDRQTVWGAVSRPVRTPSWAEQNVQLLSAYADPGLLAGGPPAGFTVPLYLTGDRRVAAEKALTWELGYRRRLTDAMTVDVAGFYSRYHDLVDSPMGVFANASQADVYGVEVATDVAMSDTWTLSGSYSLLKMDETSPGGDMSEGDSPQQQVQIHSRLDVTKDLEFNAGLYFVDALPALDVRDYTRLDLGVTWRPRHNMEVAVWGQNLLDPRHVESTSFFVDAPAMVERSVTAQFSIRF